MIMRMKSHAELTIGPGWRTRLRRIHAPVLRYGIALVFLWFGIAQLSSTDRWTGWVPEWITDLGVSASSAIVANALFELVGSLLLLAGLATRVVAAFFTIHMSWLVVSIGLTAVGVRDFAILLGALVVFLDGPDFLCVEQLRSKKQLLGV